jgi:AraC family transcriptional regulator
MPNQHLEDGHYYGRVVKHGQMADLILTETVYAPHSFVPNHSHASPYFCKILQGQYTETYERKTRECDANTLAFHPPEEIHSERFRTARVRSFNVELTPAYIKRVRLHSDILNRPADFYGGMIAWLGTKMYREFLRNDNVSPLAIEGLALEIVAVGSRAQGKSSVSQPGPWLIRAKDMLHAHFAERLTVSEVAEAVDIHPVHLAREFHRHYRYTIGEYIRHLRVEFACRQIALGNGSLAEVSIQAGFFDQSHFSRTFKALTGMTPGEYRAAHR